MALARGEMTYLPHHMAASACRIGGQMLRHRAQLECVLCFDQTCCPWPLGGWSSWCVGCRAFSSDGRISYAGSPAAASQPQDDSKKLLGDIEIIDNGVVPEAVVAQSASSAIEPASASVDPQPQSSSSAPAPSASSAAGTLEDEFAARKAQRAK